MLTPLELAGSMKVSRQAIHDLLKRVEQTLERYESMLGFLQRAEKTRALTEEADAILNEAFAAADSEATANINEESRSIAECDVANDSLKGLARLREILNELKETQVN